MAQKMSIPPTEEVENPSGCRHHWVIQAADGPVSPGLCQLCGETREFKNYVEAASWGDTRKAARSTAADRRAADLSPSIDAEDAEENPVEAQKVEARDEEDDQDE